LISDESRGFTQRSSLRGIGAADIVPQKSKKPAVGIAGLSFMLAKAVNSFSQNRNNLLVVLKNRDYII
jgi:hypothetical protein